MTPQPMPSHIRHDRASSVTIGAPNGKKVDARLIFTVEGCACQIDDLVFTLQDACDKFAKANGVELGCGCG